MHEFGTTSRQLGAYRRGTAGSGACLNPHAFMHGQPITIEDHQNSPDRRLAPITCWTSACRAMAAPPSWVTTEDRAKDLRKPPVHIKGIGFGEHMQSLLWEKKNYTHLAIATARDDAFRQADITLEDVDVAEFYDCFTTEVLMQIEGYGWCKPGEGGPLVETPGTLGPKGRLKFNTGGGLLSSHHLGNLTTIAEAIIQVRGGRWRPPGARREKRHRHRPRRRKFYPDRCVRFIRRSSWGAKPDV